MMDAHEESLKRKWHRPVWWRVTNPETGHIFSHYASQQFMAEYYGKAGWSYEREESDD